MDIENLPNLTPADFGGIEDAARPVLSYAWQAEGPHRAARHAHPRAQVIHTVSGAYWVSTPEGSFCVPRGQAIFIPPHLHHEVFSHGSVSARMLFIDPTRCGRLPDQALVMEVSPLLGELISRVVDHGNDYGPDTREARLAAVLLDELEAMESAALFVPISKDPRLARVMERLLEDPASDANIDVIAKEAGMSPRTVARLFRRETGMTFAKWRTRLRLVESLDRLTRGASVTEVALDLGYQTPSAFIYRFRKELGVSPGRYTSEHAQ